VYQSYLRNNERQQQVNNKQGERIRTSAIEKKKQQQISRNKKREDHYKIESSKTNSRTAAGLQSLPRRLKIIVKRRKGTTEDSIPVFKQ